MPLVGEGSSRPAGRAFSLEAILGRLSGVAAKSMGGVYARSRYRLKNGVFEPDPGGLGEAEICVLRGRCCGAAEASEIPGICSSEISSLTSYLFWRVVIYYSNKFLCIRGVEIPIGITTRATTKRE